MNTGNCRCVTVVFEFAVVHFKTFNIHTDGSGYNFYDESFPAGVIRASI